MKFVVQRPFQKAKANNLSLEATRLRRDETAGGWETTVITYRGHRAWAAAASAPIR